MYQNILFDLDGTLTDSMEGITKSVQYALKHYGIDEPDLNKLICFIGPPLRDSFMKYYGFDEKDAVEAVHKYRERYEPVGIYEYALYDGVEEMLKTLKENGKRIILSTAKPTDSAVRVIKDSGLDKYFDFMLGSEKDGKIIYKSQVISEILRLQGIDDLENTVMVGDKADDVIGAKQNGIDCIGVRYGFGSDDELKDCVATVDDTYELTKILLRKRGIIMTATVNSNKITSDLHNFWSNAQFHPCDAIEDDWGKYIIDKMSEDRAVQMIRIYTMFEDIVTRDGKGNLQYDYSEFDYRIDYLLSNGFDTLLICFNFLPQAIAKHPDRWSYAKRYKNKRLNISVPADYRDWQEICRHATRHLVDRYGTETVSKWYFHCWNEPDLPRYFNANDNAEDPIDLVKQAEEYSKLYDHFAEGVRSVTTRVKIGGPSAAGKPVFVEAFIKHIVSGVNHANGKIGSHLDFYSVHTYASNPKALNAGGSPQIKALYDGILFNTQRAEKNGFKIPELIVDEWGASTCGFTNIKECPKMNFRNNEYFPAFFAKMVDTFIKLKMPISRMLICLAGQHDLKADFEGYRNFFTLNQFPKPIYNGYVLMNKLGDKLLECSHDENEYFGIIPTKEGDNVKITVYYMSEDLDKEIENINAHIKIDDLNGRYTLRHYRIDKANCNSYTKWCELGMPDNPDQWQREVIRKEGKLKPFVPDETIRANGSYTVTLPMSQNTVDLIELIKI